MDKRRVLEEYFGYREFRAGQEELIDCLLSGGDVLGILPTGAGKSLCYQIPALLFPGITLVISPLISLMKDQVNALTQAGIKAAFVNSTLSAGQMREVMHRVKAGEYRIVYVAPERLLSEDFLTFARSAAISMVTVDEAHCISQWGQDFRPSYLKIGEFIGLLSRRPVIGAFTATATPVVREDIERLLELRRPRVLVTGFDRNNLYLSVCRPKDKMSHLLGFLKERSGASGIIYCATRKTVDALCEALGERGFSATRYHAGLSDAERHMNQDDFLYDRRRIMVATNAFGMGIDKSDVSYVVHYNMPKNLESYYQEAGRAGRDGGPAVCLLLYGAQDVRTNQFLILNSRESAGIEMEEAVSLCENELELLKKMTWYCTTTDCLRGYILKYFGEKAPAYCGCCSNCDTHFETVDITVEAQKILSCVVRLERMGRSFGKGMVVNILHGSKNERIGRFGLDTLSTYGILEDVSGRRIGDIIDFLLEEGWLRQAGDEYPVLAASPAAQTVLQGKTDLFMKLPSQICSTPAPAAEVSADGALFERLRALRAELAKAARVPAYIVFTDASLRDMCRRLPRDAGEFLQVSGVGQAKLERYAQPFLEEIRAYSRENHIF